jgi:hypothetical protein
MARFVAEKHLTDPADLRGFAVGGYAFDQSQSDDQRLIFRRPVPEAEAA